MGGGGGGGGGGSEIVIKLFIIDFLPVFLNWLRGGGGGAVGY